MRLDIAYIILLHSNLKNTQYTNCYNVDTMCLSIYSFLRWTSKSSDGSCMKWSDVVGKVRVVNCVIMITEMTFLKQLNIKVYLTIYNNHIFSLSQL